MKGNPAYPKGRGLSSPAFALAAVIMLCAVSLSPAGVLDPVAKWDPSGIAFSQNVVVEGTTVKISATIMILKDVRGLSFKAGVDGQVVRKQDFPGLLYAGTTLPIPFDWMAKAGTHVAFFQLFPPVADRSQRDLKITRTLNVALRQQSPVVSANTGSTAQSLLDPCERYKDIIPLLEVSKFAIAAPPSSPGAPAILNVTIKNRNERCHEKIDWDLIAVSSQRIIEKGTITPVDLDKQKYVIKGNETITFQIEHYKKYGLGQTTYKDGKPVSVDYSVKLRVRYGAPERILNITWPLL